MVYIKHSELKDGKGRWPSGFCAIDYSEDDHRIKKCASDAHKIKNTHFSVVEKIQKIHVAIHTAFGDYDSELSKITRGNDIKKLTEALGNRDGKNDRINDISKMPNGKLACQEYATLFTRFSKEAGLNSKIIIGKLGSVSSKCWHAWSEVIDNGGQVITVETTLGLNMNPIVSSKEGAAFTEAAKLKKSGVCVAEAVDVGDNKRNCAYGKQKPLSKTP